MAYPSTYLDGQPYRLGYAHGQSDSHGFGDPFPYAVFTGHRNAHALTQQHTDRLVDSHGFGYTHDDAYGFANRFGQQHADSHCHAVAYLHRDESCANAYPNRDFFPNPRRDPNGDLDRFPRGHGDTNALNNA